MPATPGRVEGGAGSASTLWVSGGTQTEISDGGCEDEHTSVHRYQAIYEGTLDTAGLAPGCYELDSPHFSLAAYRTITAARSHSSPWATLDVTQGPG